jgi:ribosome-associated heat shock protein Hsp15
LGSPAGQANNRNRCFSIARRQKSTGRIQRARSHSIGKIKINGENVKPAKEVKIGDVINVHKNSAVFSFKVLNLLDKRVGAPIVIEYIKDITPIE